MILMAKTPKKEAEKAKKPLGRPRKYESADADQERSGTSIHVYIDPAVNGSLAKYISTQVFKPSKTAVLELALREHLERAGFWPPKKNE